MTITPLTTTDTLAAVESAHRELMRLLSRNGADCARNGYSIQAAQVAVDKAQADYDDAFRAHVADTLGAYRVTGA